MLYVLYEGTPSTSQPHSPKGKVIDKPGNKKLLFQCVERGKHPALHLIECTCESVRFGLVYELYALLWYSVQ